MNQLGAEMRAFHGDPAVKAKYLARVAEHRRLDEITRGIYYRKNTTGRVEACAVGCTVHSGDHAAYETELGIPRVIARLEDGIFEGLPDPAHLDWPAQFLEAIPVGADLTLVWPKFAVWMLVDTEKGVIRFAPADESRKAIKDCADAYQRVADGAPWCSEDWSKIRAAAWAARRIESERYSTAAAAATTAAIAAAAVDVDAVDAAAVDAAAYFKARENVRLTQAEKLLQLLREAPVP